ncbi:uncharacterized protein NECHADRAFT_70163 [Fusarium vanettenii 77-13-4]|uniref:Protein-S-isoprenylcysteine O-methyltransferase n=1 Tax=Fusarium vanettenii (strain ATCC MYA-4622 / CBS 123669 / FGSC 9596 / NRRL 45880 / 77-13-4) TaxID=660122 RepID=C7Z8R6_FUSV7|nr:uncharacterized protein NECHADRAFT_70163 [Fusarium vanettenii 77-13-4]EEU38998.1 hypothetical protein NECHADRAFT_70163 [Fusarium vanettenii 77-13-4]
MAFPIALPQFALASTMCLSLSGTYMALSPPLQAKPVTKSAPSTGDSMRWLRLTEKHSTKVILAPLAVLGLHTSSLVLLYHKSRPETILPYIFNGLDTDLITWSKATSIPLALILCAGIPLRIASYASLGHNFTFALTEPDQLKTTGIYHYLQHPGYTGIAVLAVCNVLLLGRTDGILSCWIPSVVSRLMWGLVPAGLSVIMFGIWTRVKEEERMLQATFGQEWEQWHQRTARFIPWVL